MIEDISVFKKKLKNLGSSKKKEKTTTTSKPASKTRPLLITDKQLIKEKGGSIVKPEKKGNYVGRSLNILNPMKIFYDDMTDDFQFRNNFLDRKRRFAEQPKKSYRGRKGTLKVPLGQVVNIREMKYSELNIYI